jgi:hypothetical protein
VALLLGVSSAPAAAEWTTADTAREAVYLGLHVADWGQTLQIAEHPDRYSEANPILGRKPTRGRINRYFAATAIGHAAVSYLLPRPYREAWQYVTIGFEGATVLQNARLGVSFGF